MTDYKLLCDQLTALCEGVNYWVTNLANASALLYQSLPDLNWAGFYLLREGKLLLGPFQGRTACTVIEPGKGVCGTAAMLDQVQLVHDVHEFPGHIACDSASNSEIVVPLHDKKGRVIGVLDMDSPVIGRFTEEDRTGLIQFAEIVEKFMETVIME